MKSLKKKESKGIFYTPPILAQFVVWAAFQHFLQQRLPINQWLKIFRKNFVVGFFKKPLSHSSRILIHEQLKDIKVLDLGVGNGAFLVAAGKFLEMIHPSLDLVEQIDLKLDIFQKNLYGVDNNPQAILECKRNLLTWIYGDSINRELKVVQDTSNDKIRLGNVLLGNTVSNIQDLELLNKEKKRVFNWDQEFPTIFNGSGSGFDLILCNPPYVTKDISPEDNRLYRRLYRKHLFVNRFNLYHLFFARVFDLLAVTGTTVFLTSNSVLTDVYSQRVRNYLNTHFFIEKIIDFVSRTQIFPKILQGTCILVMGKRNGIKNHKTQIVRVFDMNSLIENDFMVEYIPTTELFQLRKIIPSPYLRTFEILHHLQRNSNQIKDIYRIQSGEIRPADKKIRPYYFKEIPENLKNSDLEIVVNGKNVSPYLINLKENRHKPRWYKKTERIKDCIFRENHALIPRIVFQRITAREQLRRIIAGKIDKEDLIPNKRIWVENNVNYILLTPEFPSDWLISAEALLGIFNSLLINWYMHQINLTAAVPPSDLGSFPLPQKNSENYELLLTLDKKVVLIKKHLQTCSSSSEILNQLCPICTSSGKFNELQLEIDNLVFQLYEIPNAYRIEIMKQLTKHHQYFNHH
ncbi:MAG: Eco57I restriction-modification methylase domain-containing protein [Promethearchaeota archaeon]